MITYCLVHLTGGNNLDFSSLRTDPSFIIAVILSVRRETESRLSVSQSVSAGHYVIKPPIASQPRCGVTNQPVHHWNTGITLKL